MSRPHTLLPTQPHAPRASHVPRRPLRPVSPRTTPSALALTPRITLLAAPLPTSLPPSPRLSVLVPLLPLLLLLFAPASQCALGPCPKGMSCTDSVKGFFSDPPAGHLKVGFTGLGPHQPDSCSRLCLSTSHCAFWMYHSLRPDGECKMWSHEQSPCVRQDPANPNSTFYDTQSLAFTLVGGPCKPAPSTPAAQENGDLKFAKSPCPRLHCNSPHRGFLYDHPSRGHLLSFMTGRRKKPRTCYEQCRETPGCSFWMFNMQSDMGDCVLWSAEQSPCLPEPGSTDVNTAHFDPNPSHGAFVVGGYCKVQRPEDQDVIE